MIFSWDGAGEVGNGLFPRFLDLAKEHDAAMTFFLSGIYLLPESKKTMYRPPNNPVGASDIGYLTDDHVKDTLENVRRAWLDGHEIGTHFNSNTRRRHRVQNHIATRPLRGRRRTSCWRISPRPRTPSSASGTAAASCVRSPRSTRPPSRPPTSSASRCCVGLGTAGDVDAAAVLVENLDDLTVEVVQDLYLRMWGRDRRRDAADVARRGDVELAHAVVRDGQAVLVPETTPAGRARPTCGAGSRTAVRDEVERRKRDALPARASTTC